MDGVFRRFAADHITTECSIAAIEVAAYLSAEKAHFAGSGELLVQDDAAFDNGRFYDEGMVDSAETAVTAYQVAIDPCGLQINFAGSDEAVA